MCAKSEARTEILQRIGEIESEIDELAEEKAVLLQQLKERDD